MQSTTLAGLLNLPLEIRLTIPQHAAHLDEIDFCTNHTFDEGVKRQPATPALTCNPHLPLYLICKALSEDLNIIDLLSLELEFCSFSCASRRLRDAPTQVLAHIRSVKFCSHTKKANYQHMRGACLELILGTKVHVESLGRHSRNQEDRKLTRLVATVV